MRASSNDVVEARAAPIREKSHPRTPYGLDETSDRHRSVKWLPAGYHAGWGGATAFRAPESRGAGGGSAARRPRPYPSAQASTSPAAARASFAAAAGSNR